MIRSGVTFKEDTFKGIEKLDTYNFNEPWIDDKRRQNNIIRIYENFQQKQTEIEELYRHEKE